MQLTPEETAAAIDLLNDRQLLDRILEDFERCGLVGEETNKLVGYIASVSRRLESPLAVVVQSSSAAGKGSLMDAVLAFVPEEDRVQYSAMTGQSPFYMGETDLKHKEGPRNPDWRPRGGLARQIHPGGPAASCGRTG